MAAKKTRKVGVKKGYEYRRARPTMKKAWPKHGKLIKNPSTGVRGSYKKGGLDITAQYTMADLVAAAAIPLGVIGMWADGPLPFADIVAIPMALGGLAYFGVKMAKPELLPDFAKANPGLPKMITRQPAQSALIGGSVVAVGWTAWRMNERRKLVRLLQDDPGVRGVRLAFKGRLPPSELAWLVEPGGLAKRAAEVIPLLGTANALQGYDQIMEEMPALQIASEGAGVVEKAVEGFKDIFNL